MKLDQVTAVPVRGFRKFNSLQTVSVFRSATCHPCFLSGMARTMQPARRSVAQRRDTSRVVAPPEDLHDDTHESEFSEDSENFSDEDSDYGACA
jgi:hypothetical protein